MPWKKIPSVLKSSWWRHFARETIHTEKYEMFIPRLSEPPFRSKNIQPFLIWLSRTSPTHQNFLIFLLKLHFLFSGDLNCLKHSSTFQGILANFQVLFETNVVFKDFSKQLFIFTYFSSLCEPCILSKVQKYSNKWILVQKGTTINNIRVVFLMVYLTSQDFERL